MSFGHDYNSPGARPLAVDKLFPSCLFLLEPFLSSAPALLVRRSNSALAVLHLSVPPLLHSLYARCWTSGSPNCGAMIRERSDTSSYDEVWIKLARNEASQSSHPRMRQLVMSTIKLMRIWVVPSCDETNEVPKLFVWVSTWRPKALMWSGR